MRQKNQFIKSVLATAVALLSTQVNAAGFQLNEASSAGLGRAFAGEAAIADTAASGSRNPATLMMFDRPTLSAGLIFIDPEVDISGKSAKGTNLEAKNIAPTAWVPNQHYVQPLNEQFAIGGSITSNYGLATNFNENYAAGAFGGTTDLLTANLNFSTAYRANEHFSLGLGVNAVYAKAKLERYAGEIASPLIAPTTQVVYMKGDDWGFGWNTGLLYELNENHRFGLTYRSEVKIKFEGDYSSQLPSRLNIPGLPVGTDGTKVPGTLDLTLPEMWELSGFHKVHPQWAIHYSLARTNWSSFKEIRAIASDGKTFFNKDENFDDSYRIALGTTYYYDSAWTFRAGVAFDDAASTKSPSISIPDQDRIWFTAGTSYALNQDTSLDFGLAYMHGRKVAFEEGLGNSTNAFEAEGSAWLMGANFNYAF